MATSSHRTQRFQPPHDRLAQLNQSSRILCGCARCIYHARAHHMTSAKEGRGRHWASPAIWRPKVDECLNSAVRLFSSDWVPLRSKRKCGSKCADSQSSAFKMLQKQAAHSKFQENPSIILSSNHILLKKKLKRAYNVTGSRGAWTHLFWWALEHTTSLGMGTEMDCSISYDNHPLDPNPGGGKLVLRCVLLI